MPYRNTADGTFGHSIYVVREANPRTSLPEGVSIGPWQWYEPTPPPPCNPHLQVAVEVAPALEGALLRQRWQLQDAPPPAEVTMRQATLALLALGITDATVEAAIEQIPDLFAKERARIEWRKGGVVQRSSPMVALIATGLALSQAQLDHLFRTAATL
jgi:hypothetical protein